MSTDQYYVAQNLNYSFFSSVRGLTQSLPNIYKCYIETDASGAKSVYSMAPHFQEVHSIQLDSKTMAELKETNTGDKVKYYSNSGSSLSSVTSISRRATLDCCFYLNYNNYNKDADCLCQDYVSSIVTNCKRQVIIIIDSFGLVNDCFSTNGNHTEELQEKIVKSCGSRLSNNYTVGSKAGGRYRLVLHLNKVAE